MHIVLSCKYLAHAHDGDQFGRWISMSITNGASDYLWKASRYSLYGEARGPREPVGADFHARSAGETGHCSVEHESTYPESS